MINNSVPFTYSSKEFAEMFVKKTFPKRRFLSVMGDSMLQLKKKDVLKHVLISETITGFTLPGIKAVYIEKFKH